MEETGIKRFELDQANQWTKVADAITQYLLTYQEPVLLVLPTSASLERIGFQIIEWVQRAVAEQVPRQSAAAKIREVHHGDYSNWHIQFLVGTLHLIVSIID